MKADRTIRLVTTDKHKAWDRVVHHPLQSWAWGEFRKSLGVDVVRMGVYQGTRPELAEGWQLTFHRIPFTPWTVGYFPKGPAPTKEMIESLRDIGKQKRAIYIQLEPNVARDSRFAIRDSRFLKPSHHPLFTKYTFVLDLTKSEEELLKATHPKTRYNIRVAQKHGVLVQEDNSPQAFAQYLRLTMETTARQGFYAHNKTYHRTMWQVLRKANVAHLFTATHEGKTLAAWILFAWADTVYYPYGASSRMHREVMAPNLLLWETMRWAKRQGYKSYDLWGALGPKPNPMDPWFGFHRFKEGYAPRLVEFAGSYDLVIILFLYLLYILADTLRWAILKRVKHINALAR